jgi:cytochrome c oxidase assembly factor CtaG
VDCRIPHRRVRSWLLALLVVLVIACCTRVGASGSLMGSCHQEQNHEDERPKADNI